MKSVKLSKSIINAAVATVLLLPALSFSQTAFETIALPMMKLAVEQSFAKADVNKSCAASGTANYDKLATGEAAPTSSASLVSSLNDKIEGNRQELLQDGSKCGTCQQVNQVATYTTSEPEKVLVNEACDKMPTVNIQKVMANTEIETFASATLQGTTPEGKELYDGCPNPCSFHVASATTPIENEQSIINLTVQCGQPREGSILFAKYKFSSGLIHKWTCQ